MSTGEVDAFLESAMTCRLATVSRDGSPHVSPLWFVWCDGALWLNSIVRSKRWSDLERDRRASVVVDEGSDFFELRGVEVVGEVAVVGEVPRQRGDVPELEVPERLFARKYGGREAMTYDGRHAWLRLAPRRIVSWDFRKMSDGRSG